MDELFPDPKSVSRSDILDSLDLAQEDLVMNSAVVKLLIAWVRAMSQTAPISDLLFSVIKAWAASKSKPKINDLNFVLGPSSLF